MTKARDIIPGWPRGRSTSRSFWFEQRWRVLVGIAPYDTARLTEDRAEDKAEERRKVDMMEAWYMEQRISARGNLYPQPPHENSCGLYPYIQELVIPREVFTYLQMFKENMEYITGGNLSGLTRSSYPTRSSEDYATVSKEQKTKVSSYSGPPRSDVPCVCCPGGKHQW